MEGKNCLSMCVQTCHVILTGKDDSLGSGDAGLTHAVVMRLVDPIKHRGHHVYTDNFYTSPQLFHDLRANGFGACGTLRLNRRSLPKSIKVPVKKGERKAIRLDSLMIAIKWMDKRMVTVLTTIHSDEVAMVERRSRHATGGREVVEKPLAIVQYNKHMKGVDQADQLLSYYGFGHRTVKWWRRAFFFLLDMAVVNSYVLYTLQNPDKKRRLTHEEYRVQLATDLLSAAGVDSNTTLAPHGPRRVSSQPAARLTERHFPTNTGRNEVGRPIQQDCFVCSRKRGRGRKMTTYKCQQCNLPMCIVPCFELHHTKKDPQRYL